MAGMGTRRISNPGLEAGLTTARIVSVMRQLLCDPCGGRSADRVRVMGTLWARGGASIACRSIYNDARSSDELPTDGTLGVETQRDQPGGVADVRRRRRRADGRAHAA